VLRLGRARRPEASEYQFLAKLADSTVEQVSIELAQRGIGLRVRADHPRMTFLSERAARPSGEVDDASVDDHASIRRAV